MEDHATRSILAIAFTAALAVAFTASLSRPAHARAVTPPPVPASIQVPAGSKVFLEGHAVGTQNYVCAPSASAGSGVAYVLFTPEAILFGDEHGEVTSHYFSPNPSEANPVGTVIADGPIRATWHHSRDASTVWGKVNTGNSSSDPAFVRPGAIPWLLLTAVGVETGPTGGDTLTKATFIQRLNTSGGVAPSTGCRSTADLGNQAFVPYTADYYFFQGR